MTYVKAHWRGQIIATSIAEMLDKEMDIQSFGCGDTTGKLENLEDELRVVRGFLCLLAECVDEPKLLRIMKDHNGWEEK